MYFKSVVLNNDLVLNIYFLSLYIKKETDISLKFHAHIENIGN